MRLFLRSFQPTLYKIGKIEKETLDVLRNGRVEQEQAMTDRLLGVMDYVLNGETTAGVNVHSPRFVCNRPPSLYPLD